MLAKNIAALKGSTGSTRRLALSLLHNIPHLSLSATPYAAVVPPRCGAADVRALGTVQSISTKSVYSISIANELLSYDSDTIYSMTFKLALFDISGLASPPYPCHEPNYYCD